MMDAKDHPVTLIHTEHFNAGLLSRPLFGKHEFAAIEVLSPLTQENGRLEGEDNFPVQVLMQTIVITGAILQDQRGGTRLACTMTKLDEVRKLVRKPRPIISQPTEPFIRKRREMRIKGLPNLLY